MSSTTSSASSRISLIDLSRQIAFRIDENIKKELCFAETLVLSCGHYEGSIESENASLFTCASSKSSIEPEAEEDERPSTPPYEIVSIPPPEEEEEEEPNTFHFFFFSPCDKPKPKRDSKASLLTVNGLPIINLDAEHMPERCTCHGKRKKPCDCFVKLPCLCGAVKKKECTCAQLDTICVCDEKAPPTVICLCKKDKVCVCYPGLPNPYCTCEEIPKPCVCIKGNFPHPICICKHKPIYKMPLDKVAEGSHESVTEELNQSLLDQSSSLTSKDQSSQTDMEEGEGEGESEEEGSYESSKKKIAPTASSSHSTASKVGMEEQQPEEKIASIKLKSITTMASFGEEQTVEEPLEPCVCQEPEVKPPCVCFKDKTTCKCGDVCICDITHKCICEPTEEMKDIPCKDDDNKSICSCVIPKVCSCDQVHPGTCKCFDKKVCVCGDPDDCKCYKPCTCIGPCLCETIPFKPYSCTCLEVKEKAGLLCTCDKEKNVVRKLKKKRTGKQGQTWVPEIDPRHTFFDYGYNKHHLIERKPIEEKMTKLLGVLDCSKIDEECPVHGEKADPVFKKKVGKRSLDCCSTLGGITINVENLGEEKDRFLVQVVANFSREGAKTGTRLVSIIDCNLHTLEENRTEHVARQDFIKERRNYVSIGETGYYNKITRICGEKNVVKRVYHSFEVAKNFILEGANIVLMRYLAITRHRGKVKTDTILMGGEICESLYVCEGVSQAVVNNKPMFVVKIERHIIEPNGSIHQTLTVMTLRGYIVTHEWADNAYMMHINPLLKVIPEKDLIEPHEPLRERWRQDLQLLSDYLDRKAQRTAEGGRYLEENGVLAGTIREYLQALLLLKPADALQFTRHYFGTALSALDLPHDEYFDACNKHVRYHFFED